MPNFTTFIYYKKQSFAYVLFLAVVASIIQYWANQNKNQKKFKIENYECPLSHFELLFNNENQNIERNRYSITEHYATTKDGYILKIFNVKLKKNELKKLPEILQENSKKQIVLQHPVLTSADNYFYNREKSIGFYQVNKGFDVWVGNNRGNKYSRKISENVPESKKSYEKFFDFSFQEMAIYDQPAVYKYILEGYPVDQQIHYIGHSQGNAQMFAGLLDEESSDYLNSKTAKLIAISPVVFLNHTNQQYVQLLLRFLQLSSKTIDWLGLTQILPGGCSDEKSHFKEFVAWFCHHNRYFYSVCNNIVPGVPFSELDNIMDELVRVVNHNPSGTSIKSLLHFAQMANVPEDQYKFFKYNYGPEENLKKYGVVNPPEWDLTKMKVKTVLITGTDDYISSINDIKALYEKLPQEKTKLYWLEKWDHITFLFAKNPTPLFEIQDKELQ